RRRNQSIPASIPQATSFLLTRRVRIRATEQHFLGQRGIGVPVVRDLYRPQRPGDSGQVLRLAYLLMPNELSPGGVRGVRQVVGRPFPLPMPSGRGLAGILPQEGEPGIAVAKEDHVAAE